MNFDNSSIPLLSNEDEIHMDNSLIFTIFFMYMISHIGDNDTVLIHKLTAQQVSRVRVKRAAKTIA